MKGLPVWASMSLAQIFTMVGAFSFPALLPLFLAEWRLSHTEAGWISGIYFLGYTFAVAILSSLTDRIDARKVYFFGVAVGGLASLGFAWLAEGFWSASLFRALAGIGLAGTYMPGLRALLDRTAPERQPRASAFYISCFSLGTALSFFLAGWISEHFGWRAAFAAAAAAAALALALTVPLLKPVAPHPPDAPTRFLDFRPVFRNRAAMGYILAYGMHVWELFGLRSWLVGFLAFILARQGLQDAPVAPATVAALSGLVAMISSFLGNELALKLGRKRTVALAMILTSVIAFGIGFSAHLAYGWAVVFCLIYSAAIQADSSALTTGAVAMAESGRRGITLALHSVVGFFCGFLGPLVFGLTLDLSGHGQEVYSWALAFATLGLASLLGPVALYFLVKGRG